MNLLNELLTLVPQALLERLAIKFKIDKTQQVRLPGPTLFLCLLNGVINHPVLSQRLLEEIYHQQTGGHADFTTFSKALKRLNPAYFDTLYAQLRQKLTPQLGAADAQALRLRWSMPPS